MGTKASQLTPGLGIVQKISVIRRRMDFQSVRKKTDWKSVLRFAKPHIISGQLLATSALRLVLFYGNALRQQSVRINQSISVQFLKWDRLPACHFQRDRLEAYPTN